jgi:hypothetical protein
VGKVRLNIGDMPPIARMSEIGLARAASEKYSRPDHRYRPSAVGGDGPSSGLIQVSLHQTTPSISQYQTTCISKHYSLNDQILAAFENHNEQRLYKVAFYLGLKFVETALLEIPKHGYFFADKFASLRTKSSHDAIRVASQLQEVLVIHPDDLGKEYAKLELLQFLATEQCERLDTYEAHRLQVQTELNLMKRAEGVRPLKRKSDSRDMFRRKSSGNNSSLASSFSECDVGSTLLACGESISSVFCPTLSTPTERTKVFPPQPSSLPRQDDVCLPRFPDPLWRSQTAPAKLFPPASPSGKSCNNTNALYPPSPKPSAALLNQTSLMDEDDDEDDIEGDLNPNLEDSAYFYGCRTRLDPKTTVYLQEENKLPPSYNDVLKLYEKSDNDHREVISPSPAKMPDQQEASTGGNNYFSDPPRHLRTQSDIDLERALYLSGLEVMTDARRREQYQEGGVGVMVSSDDEDNQGNGECKGFDERRDDAPPIYFHSDSAGMGASFLSDESSTIPAPPDAMPRQTSTGVSIDMLRGCFHEDFEALRNSGRIVISQIPTYQGRIVGSTNGCTVIAPLMCIHHFHNDEQDQIPATTEGGDFVSDPELSDQIIVEVIDEETPNILPAVRKNLGLQQDAFLIPSDAHESLMEQQYMCPEQFLNVCGGNILEESHLNVLLDQLSKVGPKKIGATLFFHEHVIAILQLRRSSSNVWFDIIDSLPNRATLKLRGNEEDQVTSMSSDGSVFGSQHVFPGSKVSGTTSSGILSDDEWADVDGSEMQQLLVDSIPSPQNAVRIRCLDRDALKAALRWYACSVFSTENSSYIDNYEWNENLPDFDPRVFQAFIWQEA